MAQAYSDPSREDDPYSLPNVEVFYVGADEFLSADGDSVFGTMLIAGADDGSEEALKLSAEELAGYYYWYCFPGCLPDSDPIGPFASEEAALEDAQSQD